MVYLTCFAVSVLFAYGAERSKLKRNKAVLLILSMAVTILLAGLRDVSVGTDTSHYYSNLWAEAVRSRSSFAFMRTYHTRYPSHEYLYAILLAMSAKLTGNFHVFLTVVHVIIIGCMYIGAFRLRKYASPTMTLLLFYLFYYNHSLNIIRQYMAMAILFAFTEDILERRYKRYFLALIVAVLLHNSAFIGVLPLLLYVLLYPQRKLKTVSLHRRLFLYALILVIFLAYRPIVRVMIQIGVISQKYIYYVESESSNTYLPARLMSLLEIVGILVFIRQFRRYDPMANYFLVGAVVFGILYQIAASIPYGRRIPIYFSMLNLTSLGILMRCPSKRSNAAIIKALVIIAAIAYWIVMYGYLNTSRTIPYVLGV